MGKNEEKNQATQHAFLVAWGQFAQEKRLVEWLATVKMRQKTRQHQPQTEVLEFLVAILGGSRQLQDISLVAHPLDKDPVVAEAWDRRVGQIQWRQSDIRVFLKSVSRGKTLKIKTRNSQRTRSFKLFLAFLAHLAVKITKSTHRRSCLTGL